MESYVGPDAGALPLRRNGLGHGDHPSAVVPSTDGFLSALNPCAGSLDWAYDLHFPPGEAIFADTSGDRVDEILVGASNGYLCALSQELLVAPAFVHDVDPAHGSQSADVDAVTTANSLTASWAAGAGADAYQIAIVTEGGSFVTQPEWINVGNVALVRLK